MTNEMKGISRGVSQRAHVAGLMRFWQRPVDRVPTCPHRPSTRLTGGKGVEGSTGARESTLGGRGGQSAFQPGRSAP